MNFSEKMHKFEWFLMCLNPKIEMPQPDVKSCCLLWSTQTFSHSSSWPTKLRFFVFSSLCFHSLIVVSWWFHCLGWLPVNSFPLYHLINLTVLVCLLSSETRHCICFCLYPGLLFVVQLFFCGVFYCAVLVLSSKKCIWILLPPLHIPLGYT